MRHAMAVILAALASAVLVPTVRADGVDSTIYTFTGGLLLNSGTPGHLVTGGAPPGTPLCNCSISGELTFPSPLNLPAGGLNVLSNLMPSSYSFSVDGFTLTQANSTGQFSLGHLTGPSSAGSNAWDIFITQASNPGLEIFTTCDNGCGDQSHSGALFFQTNADGTTTAVKWIGSQAGTNGNGTWTITTPEPGTLLLLGMGVVALALRRREQCWTIK